MLYICEYDIKQDKQGFVDNISTEIEEEEFEIGVKPKKRIFNSTFEKQQFIEEYTKKIKTELCKNFMLKGACQFGLECSYAHGYVELLPKSHLHKNYKTKKCKNFLNNGWCNYGARCQYIHQEKTYKKKNLNRIITNEKQGNNLNKTENKFKSTQNKPQSQTLKGFMSYLEILQKFDSCPQFSLSNLPRLNCLRQLSKTKICILSDESDP
ncbi:unnamed protein product [Paramecium sonneborni]|uniref:C3H1-type domain-containing protein n=1 Tax=Paramecium sonneborni TaxID=65129 RepID=A0A8S1K623_9CILI|nr:unnamed protein product [Paramecium sonneborni]